MLEEIFVHCQLRQCFTAMGLSMATSDLSQLDVAWLHVVRVRLSLDPAAAGQCLHFGGLQHVLLHLFPSVMLC